MPDYNVPVSAERVSDCLRRAGLALKAGQKERAARYFLEAGEPETAAILFEKLGRYDGLAEAYRASGRLLDAAAAYARAGEPLRAAELYTEAGHEAEAAEALESGGEALGAAELFVRLGRPERAAALLAEAGRYFEAAKMASDANDEKAMISYLQRVPTDARDYRDAVVVLAKALNRRGWSSLAAEKLEAALGAEPVREDNLELWYQLASARERLGELEPTSSILHKVLACRYDYREAASWQERIRGELAERRERELGLAAPSRDGERYVLGELLGEGGMGSVYRATDQLLERVVAYKVLPEKFAQDPDALERLLSEARAAASLNHPNIVTVYDVGVVAGRGYIAMELVDGESYAAIQKRCGRLRIGDAIHFLVSVCQGLDHAHRRGIVHQDLKPSNILLTTERRVKIVDFGIARQLRRGDGPGSRGYFGGTLKYIAPEQAQGLPTDARSDMYSMGATLFELLVGHPPFTSGDIVQHHIETAPSSPRSHRPEIPDELEEIVLRCLAKDPSARFASARDITSQLPSTLTEA